MLLVSVTLFATVGWSMVAPENPADSLTIVMNSQVLSSIFWLIVLSVVVIAVSFVVSGRHGWAIAPAAVPAGLCAWAIMTKGFNSLLITHVESSSRAMN